MLAEQVKENEMIRDRILENCLKIQLPALFEDMNTAEDHKEKFLQIVMSAMMEVEKKHNNNQETLVKNIESKLANIDVVKDMQEVSEKFVKTRYLKFIYFSMI